MKINDRCIGCTKCVPYCPEGTISIKNNKAVIDPKKCVCGVFNPVRAYRIDKNL